MEGGRGCCCGPQAFTSGVLGALACLLVTGGVFLAFHRWDPLWLVVSAVGALLALVGSLLHCCAEQRPPPPHKGGPQPLPAAVMPEQLVPLSNARSVSQLSLNMLPGYFPPVVAAYGIEQHSAVVQNIVGQQQQRGARLLLLSLPDHTPQASLHSLVAAVYQLDGNVLTDIPPIPENNTAPPVASPPVQLQPTQPAFKHAEVQTTTAWPTPSQPSTSLNLLDCSTPICDTLPPADQVLIPLRQEAPVATRAAPDAQPEFLERPAYARVSSSTAEVSVSTETAMSPTSSVSTNTQVLPRSSRTSSTRESRRSSVGTRRSTRSDARRPSAPADMQAPSTSSASTSASRSSEPTTAQEQIPTRSDVQESSSVTNVTSRVVDVEAPGTSRDVQTASKPSDVPSYSNPMRNETPSTSPDTQCTLNTNAQESVRSSNVQVTQERSGTHNTEVPTTAQTSSRPSERGSSDNLGCSIQMPEVSSEVPASSSNESFVNCPISSEVQVPPEVQVSSNHGASQDNVTPIHCRAPVHEILVEVPLDIAPNASTSSSSSSSSVLIDITQSEVISSTSAGLNSERLLDESLIGAVGGASSELSLSDLDEAELMERSSPPPSYDDVTHERDGSFALAYGTI